MSKVAIKLVNFLREVIEYPVIIVGSLLLYSLLQIGFLSIALPVAGIIAGAVISLVAKRFETTSNYNSEKINELDYRIPVITACLYVSSIIILYRFHTYELPTIHYVIFGAYVGFIGFEISQGQSRARVLPQILVLCFFTYWSNQFIFPAGAFQPDTMAEYVPIINRTISESAPSFEVIYQSLGALNLSFVTIFKLISETSTFTAYALLATLVLTGTILVISLLSRGLPSFSNHIVLYAALIFGISSWMLGRGMRPNKLNFFYPLILLLGISLMLLFDTDERPGDNRWAAPAILAGIVLIFGHRYSAGAGLFLLFTIFLFIILRNHLLGEQYSKLNSVKGAGIIGAYILGVLGNPLHQGPLLGRLSDTILSVVAASSASASGGPGRYSALRLEVLALSTASQILLFGLVILGFCWGVRKSEWEYDFTTVWVAFISLFLVFAVVQNSTETAPQRFYSLLVLFGFNVFAATAFRARFNQIGRDIRVPIVIFLLVSLAVFSLASPIATPTSGPLGDEIPHRAKYTTYHSEAGSEWAQKHSLNSSGTLPITQTGPKTGQVDTNRMESGMFYQYSERVLSGSGKISKDGLSLGGRVWVFVTPPTRISESVVYTNGDVYVIQHR